MESQDPPNRCQPPLVQARVQRSEQKGNAEELSERLRSLRQHQVIHRTLDRLLAERAPRCSAREGSLMAVERDCRVLSDLWATKTFADAAAV